MKAYNNTKYPIFEADQVLTQNHLNAIVSYLEEQDRLTRTGVIGVGTICGMEVTFPDFNSVTIGCGTAVTSIGFQISWEEKNFSYYKDVELPETFLHPNITTEPFLKPVFDQAAKYTPFKNCRELIHIPEEDAGKPLPDGVTVIPNARFYNEKVIMILLEVSLSDIKNCVATDCDDKGKRLQFTVRPILVDYKDIEESFINKYITGTLQPPLYIERFNVPQTNLVTGQQILNALYSMAGKTLVDRITLAIKSLYSNFKDEYAGSINNFIFLDNPRPKIDEVIKSYRTSLAVQYVYRWLNDIVDAYNEIYFLDEKHSLRNCCSDNVVNMFPLHVLLGRVITQRSAIEYPGQILPRPELSRRYFPNEYNVLDTNQAFITPWLKVAEEVQLGEKNRLRLLLERIILLINNFTVPANYADLEIKVIPSKYGNYTLSEKSIPYYYNRNTLTTLNKVWNPEKTLEGLNTSIFSYNASTYTSQQHIINPLPYNFEPYNFLRVEGHIGKPYDQVVTTLNNIKNSHRLAFNIIAVNAVDLNTGSLRMSDYKGDWGEIQLSYEIVSRRWEDIIGKCIEWFEYNNWWVRDYITNEWFDNLVNNMKRARSMTYKQFSSFLPLYQQFIDLYEKIEAKAIECRDLLFEELLVLSDRFKEVGDMPRITRIEEIIDHLDEVIMVCSKGQFRAVYQNAEQKWKSISQAITFKTFLDKNPGIENAGGVTTGGTLVLVYQDKSAQVNPVVKVQPAQLPVRNSTTKNIIFSPTIEDYSNKLKAFAEASLDRSNYMSLANYIDKSVFLGSVKDTSTIPDKVVIADFFLPYQCCGGGGDSLTFIVNPADFEPPGPADFDKPDFKSPDFFAKTNPSNES
jgi:hypothetical protein